LRRHKPTWKIDLFVINITDQNRGKVNGLRFQKRQLMHPPILGWHCTVEEDGKPIRTDYDRYIDDLGSCIELNGN
jgi:hypothetical protein